jgi:hypothetical protein
MAKLEVVTVWDEGTRLAVVDVRRKLVTVRTLRRRREMSKEQYQEMNPHPVDDLVRDAALAHFKKKGLI